MKRPSLSALLTISLSSLVALSIVGRPASAQEQSKDLAEKLDGILMLMVVDQQGQPRSTEAVVDNKKSQVFFSTISLSGAELLQTGKSFGLSPDVAKALRFAPISLARFNMIMAPILKEYPGKIAVISPDPSQVQIAEKLLVAQKVQPAQAKSIASLQPMIFCPEPGLLVSMNEGPRKGEQFVPCSTEFSYVDSIVKQATQMPRLAAQKPTVVAIPLSSFINFLDKQPSAKTDPVRVVPSGSIVSIIQELEKKRQAANPSK